MSCSRAHEDSVCTSHASARQEKKVVVIVLEQ